MNMINRYSMVKVKSTWKNKGVNGYATLRLLIFPPPFLVL